MAIKTTFSNTLTGIKFQTVNDIPNLQLWLDATSGVDTFRNPTLDQFIDSSSNNFTITKSGNPAQGTFSPFFPNGAVYNPTTHGGSCYFNGTTSYLAILSPPSNLVNWASNNFTLEYWIYPTVFTQGNNDTGDPVVIGHMEFNTNINYWSFGPILNGTVRFYYFNGSPQSLTTTEALQLNVWTHLAFVNANGNIKIYINGIEKASGSIAGTPQLGTSPLTIGMRGGFGYNGYMSNLRVVNGTALYTSNFSVPTAPLTNVTNTSLLLNFTTGLLLDGVADNNFQTFGNATISNGVKKYGLGAMYFDGNGDYFQAPSKSEYNLGTGDFTIECWVNFNNVTNGFDGIIDSGSTLTTANNTQWCLYRSGTTLTFGRHGGTTLLTHSTTSMNVQTWYHIAVTRQSDNLSMFVNGIRVATNYFPGWTINASVLRIGAITTPYYMNGYIDDVRITRGVARYGSQTSLLLNANGTNGGNNNSITDSSSNNFTITKNGTPTLANLTPFAGSGGSIYFDGGSALTTLNFTWSSGDFTIEMWVNFNTINNVYGVFSPNNQYIFDTGSGNMTRIQVIGGSLQFYINGTLIISYTLNPVVGVWYHIAVSRQSNIVRMFVNGTFIGTSVTSSETPSTGIIRIGNTLFNGGAYNAFLNGYLSNFRVVNGTAVYTSNFTPPTSPVTNIANTSLLLNTPQPSVIDSSNQNPVIYTSGNAQLSAGQSKFGGSSLYFDGNGDYLTIPANNNFNFGTENFTIEGWMYLDSASSDPFPTLISNRYGTSGVNSDTFWLGLDGPSKKLLYSVAGGNILSTNEVPVNTWTHFAVSRLDGLVRLFVNGELNSSIADAASKGLRTIYIGAQLWPSVTNYFNGYIDDLRIVKGAALYTSNFTPPTSQLTTNVTSASVVPFTPPNEFANSSAGDSNFSNVVALIQANQQANELSWRDRSSNQNIAIQTNGTFLPILSANAINSLSAVVFNGTNQFLTLSNPIQISGNYTSFFVYTRALNGIRSISLGNDFASDESPYLHWSDNFVYSSNLRTNNQQLQTGVIVGAVRKNETVYLSGQQITPFTASWGGTKTGSVNSIGRYSNSWYHNGAIGEYIQTAAMLPDSEIRLVTNSLSAKWFN
jgi:hypothetical protein